jgi:hypothetical protein
MDEGTRTTSKRWKRRSINWAAVSAMAALLSAIAAMSTAGAGIWHPPVPIPGIQVKLNWVGPTPTAGPGPSVGRQSSPASRPGTPSPLPSGQVVPGVTLQVDAVSPECCAQAFDIAIGVTNTNSGPFILSYDSDNVVVEDSTGHLYPVAHNGNHQVSVRANADDQKAIDVIAEQTILPSATSIAVTFPIISGTESVQLTWSLR